MAVISLVGKILTLNIARDTLINLLVTMSLCADKTNVSYYTRRRRRERMEEN